MMVEEARMISCAQWLELVHAAGKKGARSDEMCMLATVYPSLSAEGYYSTVQKELAGLESALLKKAMNRFQKAVNLSLEDADAEILKSGIKEFKQTVYRCFFFNGMEEYPYAIRKDLCIQVVRKLTDFTDEYENFVKRFGESSYGPFIEEFDYICRKANLKKYVEGFNVYV